MPTTDQQERARVRSRIGSLIMEFWAIQLKYGGTFLMEELHRYVADRMDFLVAPDSPGRILRHLRQQRLLNYKVVSRRLSMYRAKLVERPAEQAELFRKTA